jgi:hypothetical protein
MNNYIQQLKKKFSSIKTTPKPTSKIENKISLQEAKQLVE